MDSRSIEIAKQRYDFDAWHGTSTAGREIVRRKVTPPKNLIPEMELLQLREIVPGDGTRLIRAAWSKAEATLAVDVRECESLEKAHEIVVELLANIQAPDILRHPDPIGDISFGRKDENLLIFARGNLAVIIRNSGTDAIPVTNFARAIDNWIVNLAE